MKKTIFISLIIISLLSISFASLISQISFDGPISSKPLQYQNGLVVTMDNGKIAMIDQSNIKKWQVQLDSTPTSTIINDNSVVVSTIAGRIYKIDNGGHVLWQTRLDTTQNATKLFGISGNQKYIYASADNGLYIVDKDGSIRAKIMTYNATIATTPYTGDNFAIVGFDNTLARVSETGTVTWRAQLDGKVWTSSPKSDGANIYIGALDSKVYSFSIQNGNKNWEYDSTDWVLDSPAIADSTLYFADNNGQVFALDTTSGSQIWNTKVGLGTRTAIEIANVGGQGAILLSSDDKSIYAIERDNGQIIWKENLGSVPSTATYSNNKIAVGTSDGTLYYFSAERSCSINEPKDGTTVGSKEIEISGKDISESGGQQVQVKINDGDWSDAQTDSEDWLFVIDPKISFNSGINTISCKVNDNAGEETGDVYTTVSVNYDQSKTPSNLVVTTSANPIENVPFTVYVNDGDDGSPVNRFGIEINGQIKNGSKNTTLTLPAGSYKAVVKKLGFYDSIVTINVASTGTSPVVILVIVIAVLAIVWALWTKVLKDKFASKK